MGSDGYVWGREFISNHPQEPRELEIDKHWFNFMLWGRMGYNPDMSNEIIKGKLAEKYPDLRLERSKTGKTTIKPYLRFGDGKRLSILRYKSSLQGLRKLADLYIWPLYELNGVGKRSVS